MTYIVNGKGPAGWRIDKLAVGEGETQAIGLDFINSYVAFVREQPVAEQIVKLLNEAEAVTNDPDLQAWLNAPHDPNAPYKAAAVDVDALNRACVEGQARERLLVEALQRVLDNEGECDVLNRWLPCHKRFKNPKAWCGWCVAYVALHPAEPAQEG